METLAIWCHIGYNTVCLVLLSWQTHIGRLLVCSPISPSGRLTCGYMSGEFLLLMRPSLKMYRMGGHLCVLEGGGVKPDECEGGCVCVNKTSRAKLQRDTIYTSVFLRLPCMITNSCDSSRVWFLEWSMAFRRDSVCGQCVCVWEAKPLTFSCVSLWDMIFLSLSGPFNTMVQHWPHMVMSHLC